MPEGRPCQHRTQRSLHLRQRQKVQYKRCCYLTAKAPLAGHTAVTNGVAPRAGDHVHLCDYCGVEDVDDEINRIADRAFELLLEGRHDEAEALCRRLMHDCPDEVEGIDLLAMVCEARGERQRALELLRKAIDIADSHPGFDAETRSLMYDRQLDLEAAPPLA